MSDVISTVHHVCMYNPKLNHMSLRIILLVVVEGSDAHAIKLFVQYQLTVHNFLLGGRRGIDLLNADNVKGIGPWDSSTKFI